MARILDRHESALHDRKSASLAESTPGCEGIAADAARVSGVGSGLFLRAVFTAARLPEVLTALHECLGNREIVSKVTLVGGHSFAADAMHLVSTVGLWEVVDEEVRHGSASVMPVGW